MLGTLKKSILTAAFVTLAPVAPLVTGGASDAQAHTSVSGSITIGGPVAVVGFSYGNPYLYGPVYHAPEYCVGGPVYYYPTYRVYAPYYPAYRYYRYERPRYYYPGHRGHDRGHHYASPRYVRGHSHGRDRRGNGHGNGHGNGRYSYRGHRGND